MITYKINEDRTRLTLIADDESRQELKEYQEENPDFFGTIEHECNALEHLICNSELNWLSEIDGYNFFGDLTDAPRLCILNENDEPNERWGYMNYQIKSFLQDLIICGYAVFVS